MSAMASQITGVPIVCLTVYSGADQRQHDSSASLAFVRGSHRWQVDFPNKWPVTRKIFPFYDVTMEFLQKLYMRSTRYLPNIYLNSAWNLYRCCSYHLEPHKWLMTGVCKPILSVQLYFQFCRFIKTHKCLTVVVWAWYWWHVSRMDMTESMQHLSW